MEFYKCQHFRIEELVDRKTFEKWGQQCWMFLNPYALQSLDGIRNYFSRPVIANNWIFGGQSEWRGLRPSYCMIGATYSQHRFGNAFDIDVEGVEAEEVRQTIIRLKDNFLFQHINCLETGIHYIHFDCRNVSNRILLVTG